jgi:hypothetical protein
MSKNTLNRRQFLRLAAVSGGATFLAACGAGLASGPTPTPRPPTPTPVPPAPEPPAGASQIEEKVLVADVLDYALTSDQWPGAFGFVTFRLHQALHNGEPIYFIRTDASDPTFAQENGLVHVPLLNVAAGDPDMANSLYVFDGDRPPVIGAAPGDDAYSSLFRIHQVAVEDASLTLDSAEAVVQAAADSAATLEAQNIYVNYPVVKWQGGELSVDDEKKEYLGSGQLLQPVDTQNMEVTFKLHGCFPGTRYMITDTSAAPMAPMMSVPASPPTQALADLNGTDEIWVFGNGIEGSGVMGYQPGVFDNQAGEPAWSPFWNHFTLVWADGSDVRVLRSGDEIRAAVEASEIELYNGTPDSHPNGFVVNCPVPVVAPFEFEA